MPDSSSPSDFSVPSIARRAIGDGNSLLIGDTVLGPISVTNAKRTQTQLLVTGTAPAAKPHRKSVVVKDPFNRIASSVRRCDKEFFNSLDESRQRSRSYFRLVCVFSSLAYGLVLIAFAFVIFGNLRPGVITGAGSVLSQLLTLFFLRKDRELRQVVDRFNDVLCGRQRFLAMIDVAESIMNSEDRDNLKKEIVRAALEISKNSEKTIGAD